MSQPANSSRLESLEDRTLLAAGVFQNGEFDFCISVRFNATEAQLQQIRTGFQNASQILADATDGQHKFGNITILNNSGGTQSAEYFIHPGTGRAYATDGKYGIRGEHVNLYFQSNFQASSGADGDAYTIAHEHAHHAYGILDEYSGPNDNGSRANNDPLKAENAPFPNTAGQSFSLMDNYFVRGGRATGGAYTLNEFSITANHDPDNDTWQTVSKGLSDWSQIAASRFPATIPAGLPVDAAPAAHTVTFSSAVGGLTTVMLLDRSGSMTTENRLDFAKAGAKLFTFALDPGDSVGVSSFSSSPSVDYGLTKITDDSVRSAANAAIDSLVASGSTNIGGGLQTALGQITGSMNRACNDIIVLLSDGDHNTGTDPLSVIPALKQEGVAVFTVGVGSGLSSSGEATLQKIASDTGGKYKRVSSSFGLVGVMFLIAQESLGNGLLTQSPLSLTSNSTVESPVPVETGVTQANFAVTIADPGDNITITLRSPSGRIITAADAATDSNVEFLSGPNNRTFEIKSPEAGEWKVIITTGLVTNGEVQVQAFADHDGVQLNVSVEKNVLTFPDAIIVNATPQYNGQNVVGASVFGKVLRPDGSESPITLFDDGSPGHGDHIPGDGIYAAKFSDYAGGGDGTYTLELTTENTVGTTYAGEFLFASQAASNSQSVPAFVRLASTSAVVTGVLNSTSISGQKWNDLNGDGLHDANEPGLNGWVINVLNAAQIVIATTTTASIDRNGDGSIDLFTEQGLYTVEVPEGDWVVQEVARAGWVETSPMSRTALIAGQLDASFDFKTTQNNFQDWAGLNERWVMSNNGWHYVTPAGGLFKWLSGRGETLQAQLVAKLNPTFYNDLNLLASPAAPQTHQVTITTGSQVTGIDFGNYGASTIEGQKWEDSDRDGIRDSGERFLNGWQFQLINSDTGAVVKTTSTQSLDLNLDGWIDPESEVGVYLFEGVTPGKYEVREVLKTGWIQSTPTQDLLTLARSLDTSRDFQTSNGSFLDWGNLSEKWLLGNDGWYFITPDGALSKWNLSPRTALTGTKVAQLSPWFYQQLSRLTDAADPADSLIDVTDEIHVTGLNVGNYRANGANGLLINGNADPRLVPGNVRVWVSGADIRVAGDQFDNQVALFVDWRHNLIAVGLQGTTINGQTGPVVLLQNAWTVPGSVNADLGSGHDLIALQGFKTGKNVWVNAGAGSDSILALNMQVGGNFDVISGWGAGNVGISNSSIANNLTIWGSEGRDNVILDKVVVSNFTSINLGAGGDRLLTRGSIFHDDTRISLSYGDDVLVALGTNDFKRLLFIDGSLGTDATSANSVTAGQKIVWGVESSSIPNVEVLLDQILSELAVLGLDASLLQ